LKNVNEYYHKNDIWEKSQLLRKFVVQLIFVIFHVIHNNYYDLNILNLNYFPISELVTCNRSITVPNGFFNKVGFFYGAGSTLNLSCEIPRILINSSAYLCNDVGQWEGNGKCGKFYD